MKKQSERGKNERVSDADEQSTLTQLTGYSSRTTQHEARVVLHSIGLAFRANSGHDKLLNASNRHGNDMYKLAMYSYRPNSTPPISVHLDKKQVKSNQVESTHRWRVELGSQLTQAFVRRSIVSEEGSLVLGIQLRIFLRGSAVGQRAMEGQTNERVCDRENGRNVEA